MGLNGEPVRQLLRTYAVALIPLVYRDARMNARRELNCCDVPKGQRLRLGLVKFRAPEDHGMRFLLHSLLLGTLFLAGTRLGLAQLPTASGPASNGALPENNA